jgi:plasmid stabilization system protein ParE
MSEARIDILRYARSEIDEALSWYLDRSVRAAEGFLREIDRGLALIAQSPELWPTFESGTRRYPKGLEVVAVAHHKRRPTYWVGR